MSKLGELIQMLAAHTRKILLVAVAIGILSAAVLFWLGSGITLQGTAPKLTPTLVIIGILVLVVTLGLVVVLFCCSKTPHKQSDIVPASGAPGLGIWERKVLLVLVILGALGVGGTFAWVGWGLKLNQAGPELTLPLIVIIGVVTLLLTLALVAVTFSLLGMSDKGQALALPEGSVRAVIALMLLLVFAIAAIFLYSNVASSGRIQKIEKVDAAQLAVLEKQVTVILRQPPAGDGPYTVYFRDPGNAASDDIAKQLIVLLGTLVTAVASFYFGSSSVSSARDAADRALRGVAGPNATGVNPPSLNADGTSQPITITGVNLQNVTAVEVVSGDKKTRITADPSSVKASATNVTCNVTIPKVTPQGSYDVTVTDNTNNSSIIRISIASPAAPPAAKPEIKEIDGASLIADGQDHTVKVTGSNLAEVEQVKFEPAGGITVGKITPGGSDALTFIVKMANTTPPKRNVSLVSKAGESKSVEVTLKAS